MAWEISCINERNHFSILSEVRLGSARHLFLCLRIHFQELLHLLWVHVTVQGTFEIIISLFLDIWSILKSLYEFILLFFVHCNWCFDFHSTVVFFQDVINEFISLIKSLLPSFLYNSKKRINNYVTNSLTYHLLSLFGLHLLLPYHFFDAIIFHIFLLFLKGDNLFVLLGLIFQTLGFVNLTHLFFLEVLINSLSLVIFLLIVWHESLLFFKFTLASYFIFAVPVFIVSLSDLHYLICLTLGLLNLLPGFLFLQFKEGDTVCKQFSILCSFLLVDSCGN